MTRRHPKREGGAFGGFGGFTGEIAHDEVRHGDRAVSWATLTPTGTPFALSGG